MLSKSFESFFNKKIMHRIEITTRVNDMRSLVQLKKIQNLGFSDKILSCKVLEVYTIEKHQTPDELQKIAEALSNPISQTFQIDRPTVEHEFDWAIEIGFLPGVTDNIATTARETVEDLFKTKIDISKEGVYTSRLILIKGKLSQKDADVIADSLYNRLIERAHIKSYEKYLAAKGMDIIVPRVKIQTRPHVDKIDILNMSEEELAELGKKGIKNPDGSRRGPLALDMDYLHAIRDYFKKENRIPTDIEIESIAQTWSEHCKHTIFAAALDDDLPEGLYKGLIKKATNEIRKKKGKKDFCVSVFNDNSGAIAFDEDYLITDKAETHNSPSALDPFGGAITGIVGVNRDTIGFGKAAKPIMNKYGYCFADPLDKNPIYRDKELKNPALPPRRIIDGVVAGVNSGGNCSGIPTPQGWQYFDDRYKGKPLVFVGTVGLIPREINGVPSWEKEAKAGDKIVVIGGRVGQDGIHGATFSSEALNEGSPAGAVQIGDPITQKKLSDAIVKEARDLDLYSSITDNGAGGISCSVAEMARECGGCNVELDKVPLKYPNLEPWKIWISESQERMTLSVPSEKIEPLFDLMRRRGVEATVIGEFNDSGRCVVTMDGEKIMDVELSFLHDGLPEKHLETTYTLPKNKEPDFALPEDIGKTLENMMKKNNICSYSYISKQYDHTVQASTAIYPLQGPGQVNGVASAIAPILDSDRAIIVSQGLNPRYSDINTYHMAACAIDTGIRNAVAMGADIDYMALMDNFCWCSSDEKERLGQLKKAVQACYDYSTRYGTPFISGKDSMFNDFKGYDSKGNPIKISVPPTLLVSSLSVISDIKKAVTIDPKSSGDLVYILGLTYNELGAGEYFDMMQKGVVGMNVPKVDVKSALDFYRTFKKAVEKEWLASSISVGFGGIGVALAKKAISAKMGIEIDLNRIPVSDDEKKTLDKRPDFVLFSESQSRIIVTIPPKHKKEFEKLFSKTPHAEIGRVLDKPSFIIKKNGQDWINIPIKSLHEAYQSTFRDY